MCNRVKKADEFSQTKLKFTTKWEAPPPGWNDEIDGDELRPGSQARVIVLRNGERVEESMRWGLIPNWAKAEPEYSTHNARSETVATTPTFRDAWRRGQRCLMPANGFMERGRYFQLRGDDQLMMFGGIWDEWNLLGLPLRSCSMLTTRPNEMVGMVHNRMPVIIGPENWRAWLGEIPVTVAELHAMCQPYPDELMTIGPPGGRRRAKPQAATAQASLF